MNDVMDRIPPQNIEAEQAVLGSMMIEKEALAYGVEVLSTEDFCRPAHQEIFDGLKFMLFREDDRPDLVTLQEVLRTRNKLEEIGGTEYLMAIVDTVPTAANIERYAGIVFEKSKRRTAISKALEIIGMAHDEREEIDVSDTFLKSALELSDRNQTKTRKMIDVCLSASKRMELIANGGDPRIIPFRMEGLRRTLYGLQPGDFMLVVGETGGGKTVSLLDMASQAGSLGRPTLFCTLEMDAEDLINRMVCSDTRQNMHLIRQGEIDWDKITSAYGEYSNYPITIVEEAMTLKQLELTARRWKAVNKAAIEERGGIIIIDYFGIIEFGEKADNETSAEGKMSRRLKILAGKLDVALFSGLQFRKAPAGQKRQVKNDDARGSGAITHWATKVMFLENIGEPDENDMQKMNLKITKHRGGPTGKIPVLFDKRHLQFVEVDEHHFESNSAPTTGYRIGSDREEED